MVELDNPANAILEIEGVSAGVFLSILNGDSEQVIIERICAEYDTSHEQVVKDVETFIKHLIDRKILLPG